MHGIENSSISRINGFIDIQIVHALMFSLIVKLTFYLLSILSTYPSNRLEAEDAVLTVSAL